MIDRVEEYLTSCTDKISEFHKTRGDKTDSYERIVEVNLPTIEGLARFLNTTSKTVLSWCTQHPDFAQEIEVLIDEQKKRLIDSGLSGNYSGTITRQLLSALHGLREGTDLTTNGKALNINIVDFSKLPHVDNPPA